MFAMEKVEKQKHMLGFCNLWNSQKRQINSYYVYFMYIILATSNMLLMHYSILGDKSELTTFSYLYNLFYTVGEISLVCLCFSILRYKCYLLIPVFITFIIAYCNILYYRYFGIYMPLSLYTEFNNLNGLSDNIVEAFKLKDLFLLVPMICGTVLYRYIPTSYSFRRSACFYSTCICIVFVCVFISYVVEWKADRYVIRFKFEHRIHDYRYVDPAKSMFELGFGNTMLLDLLDAGNVRETIDMDKMECNKFMSCSPYSIAEVEEKSNLIVILVESLLSIHSDLIVDGKEISPNLNILKREGVYYEKMVPEIELGESADGQFIYMTGLLPEKKGVTAIDFVGNKYVSIVHQLKSKNPQYTSRMIIPTAATFWRQNEWCSNYGIDTLISKKDADVTRKRWLEDEDIFNLAMRCDSVTKEPFVSFILTSSTHTPYDELMPCDINWPDSFPFKYSVYLSKIHYMDRVLGEYIRFLKKQPWYENTVIVIVSDHHAHSKWFDMADVPNYIPLYILNAPVNVDEFKIKKKIYQTDLYPTLLDFYGIQSNWRGVGQSVLMPDSIINSSSEKLRIKNKNKTSMYILYEDYFRKNVE